MQGSGKIGKDRPYLVTQSLGWFAHLLQRCVAVDFVFKGYGDDQGVPIKGSAWI
jgi:hypothetical protein